MTKSSMHALALVVLCSMPAVALASDPLPTHACAAISPAADRLACYDAAFPPLADPAALAAAREKAVNEFGLSGIQLRERTPEHIRKLSPDRIQASVTRVTMREDGSRVLTLDNGQVWWLTEATSKGPLEIGDQVAIRTAALGSFMLITPSRVPLRARRIN